MHRRTCIIGTGSLAGGAATAFGTVAFSSGSAERDVTVETAADGSGASVVDYDEDGTAEVDFDGFLSSSPVDTP